jgi:hypothetical protein
MKLVMAGFSRYRASLSVLHKIETPHSKNSCHVFEAACPFSFTTTLRSRSKRGFLKKLSQFHSLQSFLSNRVISEPSEPPRYPPYNIISWDDILRQKKGLKIESERTVSERQEALNLMERIQMISSLTIILNGFRNN